MTHAFAEIAFTPSVQAEQRRDGSRAGYARSFEGNSESFNDRLGPGEVEFIAGQRSMFLATTSATGWPYVQHRGGPRGFLKVLNDRTLAFADFAGNRQFISVGNATDNDRVALILVDYTSKVRLKLLGRMAVKDLQHQSELAEILIDPAYPAKPQRAVVISVAAFDWNCPQHIPVLIEEDVVLRLLKERDQHIGELAVQLDALRHNSPTLPSPSA